MLVRAPRQRGGDPGSQDTFPIFDVVLPANAGVIREYSTGYLPTNPNATSASNNKCGRNKHQGNPDNDENQSQKFEDRR